MSYFLRPNKQVNLNTIFNFHFSRAVKLNNNKNQISKCGKKTTQVQIRCKIFHCRILHKQKETTDSKGLV